MIGIKNEKLIRNQINVSGEHIARELVHRNQIQSDFLNYDLKVSSGLDCSERLKAFSDVGLANCNHTACSSKAGSILCGNKKIVKVLKKFSLFQGKAVKNITSNNENCDVESQALKKIYSLPYVNKSTGHALSQGSFLSQKLPPVSSAPLNPATPSLTSHSQLLSSAPIPDQAVTPTNGATDTGLADDKVITTYTQITIDLAPLGLKTSGSDLPNFKCSKCLYQAFYTQQFRDHLLQEHGDEVSLCLCCPFLCFKSVDLQAHYKEFHPRCYCGECGFVSKYGYILKRHKQSHSEEGRRCAECGKLYKDQYVLKMHMKMVHTTVEKSFKCEICSKEFNRKAHLKRHMKTHNPNKPFRCPYEDCSYRGSERSDINKHLLIHREPKYECSICHRLFRHAKNRDLHTKRHTGEKDYKCGNCNFYGYTFTDVRKHIKRKHTKFGPLTCRQCLKVFGTAREDHKCDDLPTHNSRKVNSNERKRGQKHQHSTKGDIKHPPKNVKDVGCVAMQGTDQFVAYNQANCLVDEDNLPLYQVRMPNNQLEFSDEEC